MKNNNLCKKKITTCLNTYVSPLPQIKITKKQQNNKSYLKCTFSTHTVIHTLSDTSIMVNSRYFPKSGIASDVGGIISASNRKNTVSDTKIEMLNDIYGGNISLPEMYVYNAHCDPNTE